jgi:hypothetical protein
MWVEQDMRVILEIDDDDDKWPKYKRNHLS